MADKAFSIALRETRRKLVDVLNNSGLPIDVMDMVVGDLARVVHQQAESDYQADLAKAEKEEKKANGSD